MNNRQRGAATMMLLLLLGMLAIGVSTAPAQAGHRDVDDDGEIVLKLAAEPECSLGEIARDYRLETVSTVLGSRGIYLVRSQRRAMRSSKKADDLAKKLKKESCVVYAERDRDVLMTPDRYHAWPTGENAPADEAEWRRQSATELLELAEAGTRSTGAGVTVAVLDTGVDASHPVLRGHVVEGWDYVGDDADPDDEAGGRASGHGTFVAGLVNLVAPDATVISMRVLNTEGEGEGYLIAEAIHDAVMMGAKVVNLSLGTANEIESRVLTDMIKWARSQGTITTAAAGNDGTEEKHWPAAQPEVVSVAALDVTNNQLAAYSNRGSWVDVAALGTELISLAPGGGYELWSGTSMATPIVSAQLSLIVSAKPRLDLKQVEEQVWDTSRKLKGAKLRYGGIDIPASILSAVRTRPKSRR